MRCPFWQRLERRVEPKFDTAGQKIGEEVRYELGHENCKKAECELFDATNQLCAILSINRTASLILENLSRSLPVRLKGDFDTALYEKTEMLSVVFSTNLSHLQEALKGYKSEIGEQGKAILDQLKVLADGLRGLSCQLELLGELRRPAPEPPEPPEEVPGPEAEGLTPKFL